MGQEREESPRWLAPRRGFGLAPQLLRCPSADCVDDLGCRNSSGEPNAPPQETGEVRDELAGTGPVELIEAGVEGFCERTHRGER